jgi:hypothetical protein
MPITNVSHASPRYRNPLEFSFTPTENSRRDTLLRTAFVNIVAGFSCRPEPRSAWDEAATGDLTPWKKIVHPIRHALNAAVLSGDQELIAQTLEGARAFCRELEADFASLVPQPQEESIVAIALDETKCEGPANEVQAALLADPSPTSADRAVLPLERQWLQLGELIDKCRRVARSRSASLVSINGGVR